MDEDYDIENLEEQVNANTKMIVAILQGLIDERVMFHLGKYKKYGTSDIL